MSSEERTDSARQVADLNKYGQALNNCESVEEVVPLTLEAVSLLLGFQYTTFVEVRDGDLRVVHSTSPEVSQGDDPGEVAYEAHETRETVVRSTEDAGNGYETVAVPATIVDDVVAIIVTRTAEKQGVGEEAIRPIEILASHAATAISNIRSRERLERARRDLEKRKEMVEMYDRLLRHDLGNDLQVVTGFAEYVAEEVDGKPSEYAERIRQTARSSADLIGRVGDLVATLEEQAEPEPRSLKPVLSEVVTRARDQYESLSVSIDPEAFEYRVYGGDLLDSVFTNVITNAAVHNEGDVRVELSAHPEPDRVTVSVADDGSGVPDSIRDSLFEMGTKGADSDGTGFGLGFVKTLTESYGGDIEVRESDAGGAEFRITLERV